MLIIQFRKTTVSCMERFTSAIRQSLVQGNWFAAIFIGLALPDICGALETPNAGNGARYKRWFNENLKHKYHHENYFEAQYARDPEGTEQRMRDPMFRDYYERQKLKPLEDDLQFTAEDCYAFRNACLHSGMSKDRKRRFALTPPPSSGGNVHRNFADGALQLQIDILCLDICEAVEQWSTRVADNKEIQQRISELLEVKFDHFPGLHIAE